MSNIDTSTINTNFPVPGTNNSTQGFRDNFTSITTNFNTASNEISDLQNKTILKSALNNGFIDNDMANTVVANVQTVGFRSSTYNLSNSIPVNPNVVVIDVSQADVHFGTIQGNTSFVFGGWSPSSTQSVVELHIFTDTNTPAGSTITFPNTTYNSSGLVQTGMTQSCRMLENYTSQYATTAGVNGTTVTPGSSAIFYPGDNLASVIHTNTISLAAGAQQILLRFISDDCGTTIDVEPINRSFKSSQMIWRTPTSIGLPGDMPGTMCTDGTKLYICKLPYDSTTKIWTSVNLTTLS